MSTGSSPAASGKIADSSPTTSDCTSLETLPPLQRQGSGHEKTLNVMNNNEFKVCLVVLCFCIRVQVFLTRSCASHCWQLFFGCACANFVPCFAGASLSIVPECFCLGSCGDLCAWAQGRACCCFCVAPLARSSTAYSAEFKEKASSCFAAACIICPGLDSPTAVSCSAKPGPKTEPVRHCSQKQSVEHAQNGRKTTNSKRTTPRKTEMR